MNDRKSSTWHQLPLYQRMAERITRMIDDGTFPPGSRIPSLRRLKAQMGVSIATAMEAYRLLEDRGVIEARPQSGFYVRLHRVLLPVPDRTAPADHPVTLDSGDLLQRLIEETGDKASFSFGAAAPHPSFLPTTRLSQILAREVRHRPGLSQSYDSVPGLPSLRRQIARRALEAGCTLSPEELVTTNGARHAMYLGLRTVTRPGDSVLVESPTYLGLLQVLESLDLRAFEIATDPRDGICLECVEKALGRERPAACVLVPSFGNPLGHCMPDDNRRELVEILSDAGIPIIEDDVDGDLFYGRSRPRALKAFDRDGTVMLCSSFSKTLAPGYRVGWIAPGRHLDAVLRMKYVTSVATVTPTQMAIASYLEHGGFDRHLRKLRGTYRSLLSRLGESIGEHFPAGTRMTRPRGGHVAWVELPEGTDSMRLFEQARTRGISLVPGPLFSASGEYRNFIRLNYAVPWSDRVEQAIEALGKLAREQIS